MKKYIKRLVPLALALLVAAPVSVAAISATRPVSANNAEMTHFVGLIEKIKVTDLLFGGRLSVKATVVKEDGQRVVLHIGRDTVLADQATGDAVKKKRLEDGMLIYAAYPANTPMSLSEPPVLSPAVVVILDQSARTKIKYDKFDGNGISSDGVLKITMSEQTKITDKANKPLTVEEAAGRTLLVFFDQLNAGEKGLPAQTTPNRVIVVG